MRVRALPLRQDRRHTLALNAPLCLPMPPRARALLRAAPALRLVADDVDLWRPVVGGLGLPEGSYAVLSGSLLVSEATVALALAQLSFTPWSSVPSKVDEAARLLRQHKLRPGIRYIVIERAEKIPAPLFKSLSDLLLSNGIVSRGDPPKLVVCHASTFHPPTSALGLSPGIKLTLETLQHMDTHTRASGPGYTRPRLEAPEGGEEVSLSHLALGERLVLLGSFIAASTQPGRDVANLTSIVPARRTRSRSTVKQEEPKAFPVQRLVRITAGLYRNWVSNGQGGECPYGVGTIQDLIRNKLIQRTAAKKALKPTTKLKCAISYSTASSIAKSIGFDLDSISHSLLS